VTIGLLVMAGCGAETPTVAALADGYEETACPTGFPFEPTYLPEGFTSEFRAGPAPGSPPADKGQIVGHYRGPQGQAIELRRPATPFTELALADDAPTIDVLGRSTAGFGPAEPGGDRFIVQFSNECSDFSLEEYGVALEELKRVAEGLRSAW
jgi:hypothetical protein